MHEGPGALAPDPSHETVEIDDESEKAWRSGQAEGLTLLVEGNGTAEAAPRSWRHLAATA
jgi:hypothetical protein